MNTIKCSLTKPRIKLDAGEWGSAIAKAKSEKTCTFQITNQALTHAAARYRKLKDASTEAPAVIDQNRKIFRTLNMAITLK